MSQLLPERRSRLAPDLWEPLSDLELAENELSICGRTGRFAYRIVLPDQVDAEKVEAKLSEGVPTVRVPKSERAQRRKVEVKA